MPTPQRLPIVGSDDGVWGDIIRQYLMKEHYNDDTDNPENGGHHKITVRAGTTAAGTAPIKLTSGSLMTTPEAGAIEFLSDKLYFTQTTGTTRKTIAAYDDSSGATGDVYYRDSGGHFVRLGIGGSGDVLTVSGGVPSWSAPTGGSTYADNVFTIQDNGDNTKQLRFEASGISAGTTRTLTAPDANTTIVGTDATQTLSNKTLTSPVINNPQIPTSIYDTNWNQVIDLVGIGSAVNHYYLTNQSTGNYPTIGVDGSDSNIGMTFAPKGSGTVRVYAETGQTPTLDSIAADGNGDLNLVTYGTGKVKANSVEVATISGTQTLTNKTINASNNTLSNIAVSHMAASAVVTESEGISSNDNDTTIPTSAAVKDYVDNNGGSGVFPDDVFKLQDDGDTSKQLKFQLSGITASNTRTLTVPDASTTIVGTDTTQTLTNKTISGSDNTLSDISLSSLDSAAYGTTPTAGTLAEWDSDNNLAANAFIPGFTSVTTAAGTTTLTAASAMNTQFTGSTTQTCVLPDATTLLVGRQFVITNRSTNSVQVNMNGGSALQTMVYTSQATFTLTNNSTAAGTWDTVYMTTGGDTGTPASAVVATSENTTSTTYADLTTTTDTVTVTIGSSGMAQVFIHSYVYVNTPAQIYFTFAMSGANTLSASDTYAVMDLIPSAGWFNRHGSAFLLTGLNSGSTTFKMKYKVQSGATGTFADRRISVVPINNTNQWGGPTNSIQGNYSSRPSASAVATGSMFFCTDSDAVYTSDGSNWTKIRAAGLYNSNLADPPTFTATTTLGTSSIAADADGRVITAPTSGGAYDIRGEYLTLSPSSNYTATAHLDANLTTGNITTIGIFLRESSSGKIVMCGPTHVNGSGWFYEVAKYSSESTYNSRYGTYAFTPVSLGNNIYTGWPKWLRIRDDGTYRYFEASLNGFDWFSITSTTNISRTDYITPNQIGWFVQSSVSSYTVKGRLRSFKVA